MADKPDDQFPETPPDSENENRGDFILPPVPGIVNFSTVKEAEIAQACIDLVYGAAMALVPVHWGSLADGINAMLVNETSPHAILDLTIKRKLFRAAHAFLVEVSAARALTPEAQPNRSVQ